MEAWIEQGQRKTRAIKILQINAWVAQQNIKTEELSTNLSIVIKTVCSPIGSLFGVLNSKIILLNH